MTFKTWFLHGDIRFARAWPAIFLGAIALFTMASMVQGQTFNTFDDASGNNFKLTKVGTLGENVSATDVRLGLGVGPVSVGKYANITANGTAVTGDLTIFVAVNKTGTSASDTGDMVSNVAQTLSDRHTYRFRLGDRLNYEHAKAAGGLYQCTSPQLFALGESGEHTAWVTRSATEVKMALDGVVKKTCAYDPMTEAPKTPNNNGIRIGCFATKNSQALCNSGSSIFQGQIHEVRIWEEVVGDGTLASLSALGTNLWTKASTGTELALYFFEPANITSAPIDAETSADGYHFLKDVRLNDVANDGADVFVRRNDLDTTGSPNPNSLERLHRFAATDLTHEKQVDPCDGGAGRNGVFGRGGLALTTDGFVIAACRGTFTGDFNSVLFTSELSEVGHHDFDTNPGKTDLNDGDDPTHWISYAAGTGNNLTAGIPDPDGSADELVSVDAVNLLTRWRKSLDGLRASDRDRTGTGWSIVTGSFGTRIYGQTGALVTNQGGISGRAVAIHGNDVWVATDETVTRYNTTANPWSANGTNTDPTGINYGALRASRDGNFLVAWSSSSFWLLNSTSMETIGTGLVTDMVAADIRADNEALYVANYTTIFKYDITGLDNITFDPGGVGDDGGTGSTEDDDVTDPDAVVGDPNAPGFDATGFAEAANISVGTAGWILGILWIFALGGGAYILTNHPTGFVIGGLAGFGVSITVGLIPTWVAFLLFVLAALAVVAWRRA